MSSKFKTNEHVCDFCVIGGGLAGMCAAVAAARHGLSVVIMHDRPVFGGNASSEIRMWVCGAHGKYNRETGIIEEIALENLYRNPYRTYPLWDSILFEIIKKEKNITALLNCTCNDCKMNGDTIESVTGWQMTTQQYHIVNADYFADCSGDSVLAPLTGAEYRMGREGRKEFEESIAPENADLKTMGMSCLIQARQTNQKHVFIPPKWANKYTKDELPHRLPNMDDCYENFWYIELGGTKNCIDDTEEIRDELLKVAYGIWDFVKNSGEMNADNWELEFVGFLPGKRESRRYVGDHIMTQNDIRNGGHFDDIVAYGGWTMDDHDPDGIETCEPPTIYHDAPSPFGIAYRCLYSKNIKNLFFAGRNISVTHSALSSTRVMATCAILGQAVGTAAAVAAHNSITPRGVCEQKIYELQQMLMRDDCYIPFKKMQVSDITKNSVITATNGDVDALINGFTRQIGGNSNCWRGLPGDSIYIDLGSELFINKISFIFDSDLNRETVDAGGYLKEKSCICNIPLDLRPTRIPQTLLKDMRIEIIDKNGMHKEIKGISDNHQRLVNVSVKEKCCGIKLIPLSSHGSSDIAIFSVDIL